MTLNFTFWGSNWESNNFKTYVWIIMKLSEINASQIYFWLKDISDCDSVLTNIRGFIKLKKSHNNLFNFDLKYFFNKRTFTLTCTNPMKYSWNSTGKINKKNITGFLLQEITPWNHINWTIDILGGTLGAWEPMWN